MFPYPPEFTRPCYFGMCVDSYDNFTTDRIALGYASSSHGSCVREMGLKGTLLGKLTDVEYPMHRGTSVDRAGDRTIVRFTVSQYWPDYKSSIMPDGPFRTMWAIGKLMGSGTGCGADFGYHGLNKGLSPVDWLMIVGSTPCVFSDAEMGGVPGPAPPAPAETYACVGGKCTPGAGGIPITSCNMVCEDRYACVAGKCTPDDSGTPIDSCEQVCGGV